MRQRYYTMMGDSVDVAKGLQSSVPLNSMLVSEKAIDMVREQFICSYFKKLSLKGRNEPVKSHIIEWVREHHVERWEKSGKKAHEFVGRNDEIKKIEKHIKENRKGIIIIAREGGIGKSRLVNEVLSRNSENLSPLNGHTLSYVRSSFYPIIEMINKLFSDKKIMIQMEKMAMGEDSDFYSDMKKILGKVASYGIGIAGNVPDRFIRDVKMAFLKLIILYMQTYKHKKIVIQVEDLHWIDESSMVILKYLVEEVPDEYDLFIMATTRDNNELGEWLEKNSLIIKLSPLDFESGKKLLNLAIMRRRTPVEILNGVLKIAGGNPLYVEETARILLNKKDLKSEIYRLMYEKSILGKDVTEDLELFVDKHINENWESGNNEVNFSLLYYLLSNEVKNKKRVEKFLLNKSKKMSKSREKELSSFPTYKDSFSIKKQEVL